MYARLISGSAIPPGPFLRGVRFGARDGTFIFLPGDVTPTTVAEVEAPNDFRRVVGPSAAAFRCLDVPPSLLDWPPLANAEFLLSAAADFLVGFVPDNVPDAVAGGAAEAFGCAVCRMPSCEEEGFAPAIALLAAGALPFAAFFLTSCGESLRFAAAGAICRRLDGGVEASQSESDDGRSVPTKPRTPTSACSVCEKF